MGCFQRLLGVEVTHPLDGRSIDYVGLVTTFPIRGKSISYKIKSEAAPFRKSQIDKVKEFR